MSLGAMLAQNPPNYQQVPGMFGIFWIVSVIISIYVGWWYNHRHAKLKVMEVARQNLKDAQEKRREHRDAHVELDEQLQVLLGLVRMKSTSAHIDAAREKVCAALLQRAAPAFFDCMEWEHLQLADKGMAEALIIDEIVPELRWFAEWLTTLNAPALLGNLGERCPARIEKRFLNTYYKFLKGVPANRRHACKAMLGDAITRVIDAGQPELQ